MKLLVLKCKSRLILLKPAQGWCDPFFPWPEGRCARGQLPRTRSTSRFPQHSSECNHKPLWRDTGARATLTPTCWRSFTLQRINKYLRRGRVRRWYGGWNTAGKCIAVLNRVLQMLTSVSTIGEFGRRWFCYNSHTDIIISMRKPGGSRQAWHLAICFIPQTVPPFLNRRLWLPHFNGEFIWCCKISAKISVQLNMQELIWMEIVMMGIKNWRRK